MAEKVGEVYIEASIDTNGVINAGKSISKATDGIERDLAGVGTAANAVNTNLTKTAAAVEQANSSMRSVSGTAGQLGFQLQDIAVQAQAGTSAFVILGQQGSQIASAFGPGGAVFGAVIAIASAIGGVLYAAMKKTGAETVKLSDALESRLGMIKERLNETDEASKAAFSSVEIGKANAEYEKLGQTIEDLRKRQESYKKQVQEASNPDIRRNYENLYSSISDQIEKATRSQKEQGVFIERVTAETLKSREGWEGVTEEINNTENKTAALAAQIQAATLRLTEGELVARKFAAAQALSLSNAEMLPPEIELAIEKLYQLEQAEKAALEQKKQALATQCQIREEIQAEAAAELKGIQDKRKAEEDQKKKVTTEFESVQTGIRNDLETPAQQADRELAERLAVIGRYGEQEKLTRDQIRALEVQAESAHQKQITDIRKSEETARSQTMQSTLSAFGDMFGNLADIAKEGGEKTFKQYKMLASAQAAISAALAITNVLANPLIPYPLNIGLAASVGALAAVQISKIQGQQYSAGGGRLYGGPVQAGGMYPVTEDGRPEILKQGNRQYLLPGSQGGEVISNRDMQPAGAGGGITIHYAPTIYAQQTDFEEIMAGQPEAVLNAVRAGLAAEGRTF